MTQSRPTAAPEAGGLGKGIDGLVSRAAAMHGAGRFADAVATYRCLARLVPGSAEIHCNLGVSLERLGRLDEAARAYRQAIALRPDFAEAHANLGVALMELGKAEDTIAACRQAIALRPDLAEAYTTLGSASVEGRESGIAMAAFRRSIILRPDYAKAHANLAAVLGRRLRLAEAMSSYEQALRLRPNEPHFFKEMICCALYRDDLDAVALRDLHRRFGRAFAQVGLQCPTADPDPRRRLRIGYLSSDLHYHPVAANLLPVLRHHDRSAFALHFYAHVKKPDGMTDQFRTLADGWCDITGLSDAEVAKRIRADRIDILVSLAGRFDDNRPLVCAHRAAPVQIGMHDVATSGLDQMDYIIADRWLAPRGTSEFFTERPLRLPNFTIADVPDDLPPLVETRPPGPPVFGCFNNPLKITPSVLRLWGRVLAGLPSSSLVLQYMDAYRSDDMRVRIVDLLTQGGAAPGQAVFVTGKEPFRDFLARYNAIDVALDTFPFSGSTTSFQALCMGVPVVTRPWDRMVSRWTESMLRTLGLGQLVAASDDEYVAIALALAGNADRWRQSRGEIRQALAGSALCDGARWARHIERFYRAVWRRHCAQVAAGAAADSLSTPPPAPPRQGEGRTNGHPPHQGEGGGLEPGSDGQGCLEEAMVAWHQAITLRPGDADAHHYLGAVLKRAGRTTDAVAVWRQAAALRPDWPDIHRDLGVALADLGRLDEAVAACRTAITLDPANADSQNRLAAILLRQDLPLDAAIRFDRAARLHPGHSGFFRHNLGAALTQLGRLDQAIAAFHQAAALEPGYAPAHNHLGIALLRQGRLAEAAERFSRALALRPGDAAFVKNLLSCAVYRDDIDNRELERIHLRQGAALAQPATPCPAAASTAGRRLRIGYLSADLREHPVAGQMLPGIRHHDRTTFSIHFYAHVPKPDAMTDRFRTLADGWCDIAGLSDAHVAERIRADKIDILISLAGRFDENRPQVCAYRAAPVQISLHDSATSGLEAMDYILADRWLIPGNGTEFFGERPLRVPLYYVADFPRELPDLPTERSSGPPVFGSFNNPTKITPSTLRLWGRILAALPDSHLVFKFTDRYHSAELRHRFVDILTRQGAATEQAVFITEKDSRHDFLARCNGIDLALDSFPFSGSTTTFQALAMGVPVVTWPWDRMASRWTMSMLRTLRLEELIAGSAEDYVAIALAVAGDVDGWFRRRRDIRDRLAASALCDGARWARQVERLYRAVWRRYCGAIQ